LQLVDVVGVRSYGGGSQYLLIPARLSKRLGIKDGDSFACYIDGEDIHYQKTQPCRAEVEAPEVVAK